MQQPVILSVVFFAASPPLSWRKLANLLRFVVLSVSSDATLAGFLNHCPVGPNTAEYAIFKQHAARRRLMTNFMASVANQMKQVTTIVSQDTEESEVMM